MTAKTKAADVLHGPPLDERELAEVYFWTHPSRIVSIEHVRLMCYSRIN